MMVRAAGLCQCCLRLGSRGSELFHNNFLGLPLAHSRSVTASNRRPEKVQQDGLPAAASSDMGKNVRFNVANIQMIPDELRDSLFKVPASNPDPKTTEECIAHLKTKGLWGFKPQTLSLPDLRLPELYEHNIDAHFRMIAEEQIKPYVTEMNTLLSKDPPPFPKEWIYKTGWTKYGKDGTCQPVDYPSEHAIVFDVETCLSSGKYPTLAAAVSSECWYTWCSQQLVDDFRTTLTDDGRLDIDHLIPLELPDGQTGEQDPTLWKHRVVIGHNVSFDRSYVKEQYLLLGSQLRFLDTMSLHVALAGFTNVQRAMFMKYNAARKRKTGVEPEKAKVTTTFGRKKVSEDKQGTLRRWLEVGSMNNLADVYRLHCEAELPYDKSLSDVFVKGELNDVRENFQALMTYCASDVRATHQLVKTLMPKFREAMPHPVTLGGLLEMSSAYLPVNNNWEAYITKANTACDEIEHNLKKGLMVLAKEALIFREKDAYKDDLWLWDLDWSVQKPSARIKKARHLMGYPKWYRDICNVEGLDADGGAKPEELSLRMRIAPKIMRLTWNGWPLHHAPEYGWGWLEPDLATANPAVPCVVVPKTKTAVTAKKNEPDLLFPLQKLLDLAKGMDPIIVQPVAEAAKLQKENPKPEQGSQALSEDDWEKLSNMTSDEQQEMFSRRFPDKPPTKSGAITEIILAETDDDLVTNLSDNIEVEEYNSKKNSLGGNFGNFKKSDKPGKKKTEKKKAKSLDPLELNEFRDVVPGCIFRRLPHTNGIQYNVGSPLSRDFLQHFESGILRASFGNASDVIKHSKTVSYWHNNKDRVESQLVGYVDPKFLNSTVVNHPDYSPGMRLGAILPRLVHMGTVTRRAVEGTWLTASNAKPDRIGSELKAMIQAPPGYSIVGADVDSQELWIAALLGDAKWLKEHGCTAFGWMTLQGNKADGTDLHSKTASQAGVGRDQAKILNYGRIYGAGREYAALLLQNFNRELTDAQASGKAQKIYSFSKGTRLYKLNAVGKFLAEQCCVTDEEAARSFKSHEIQEMYEIATKQRVDPDDRSAFAKILTEITESAVWTNGSESHMFNMLESIARSDEPRTPVLGCRISACLLKENVNDDFMTSRMNWIVQSSAVDYLHLMLVCMKWLMHKYKINGRFCLSIHDEVRYIVEDKDRYRAALALHMTNLLTRAMFSCKLGIYDLPQSVAYFSAVDVDKVMRKEISMDCVTPSNPEGLEKAYRIGKGEALDIYQTLAKTDGILSQKDA